MENKRLKNSTEAAKFRNELLKKQKNIDPITKEQIKDPVLDHMHFGKQNCRQVLQREVNSWEGKVQNSFNRYMKHLTDKPLHEVLRNLADYLEKDYSDNPVHHTALSVDVNKFKALSADRQREILIDLGVQPESNGTKRANQARKLIKTGALNMLDIKKGS
ncbi:DNA endonuclease VII [Xanthomonas phage XaC1]|nr:DNA endonuclease VII [Xanthomonas phage XaC1]